MDLLNYYAKLHFLAEEALMKAAGYPDIDAHVELHHGLMDQVRSIAMAKGHGDEDQVGALLVFLKEWWLSHINNEDKKYIAIIRKHLRLR